jgi:hypothetical protein
MAIKVPCVVATTAAITLSGEQTIDGVLTSSDRVLVKNQSDQTTNGIYDTGTGDWTRAVDFDGNRDITSGTLIKVNSGSTGAGFWYVSSTDPITFGSSNITFAQSSSTLAVISAYWQTVIDDTTAAQSRNTLLIDAQTTVASATTPDIWTTTGHTIDYTGTVTATGFAAAPYAGSSKELICAGAAVFTAGANMVIAGTSSGNYTAAANDRILVVAKTTTQFLLYPLKASGASLAISTPLLWQQQLQNAGLTVAMSGTACTVTLIEATTAGTPSTTSPVDIGFRNATVTTGDASKVSTTATKAVVIPASQAVGTVSGQASRIWVAAILVSGAVELAVYNSLSGTSVAGFNEGGVITTSAISSAPSAQTWYSTTARSNVPFVIIGYFESTQGTAGTWASAATAIVINPKYRPGMIVQSLITATGAVDTTAVATPVDDTIPQYAEGKAFMSVSVTPSFAGNLFRVDALASHAVSAAAYVVGFITKGATGGALSANQVYTPSAGNASMSFSVGYTGVTGGSTATTFEYVAGAGGGGTISFNGISGSRYLGGVYTSRLQVQEIFV